MLITYDSFASAASGVCGSKFKVKVRRRKLVYHVEARDDSTVAEVPTGLVNFMDGAGDALRAVDDDDFAIRRLLQRVGQVLPVARDVSSAEGLKDDAPHRRLQKRFDGLRGHVGEDSENSDVLIELGVDGKLRHFARAEDETVVDLNVDSHLGDWRHVWRVESVERLRTDFDRSVASEQLRVEKHADLGNHIVSGDDQRAHEVVFPVGAGLENWDLRSSDDDGLAEILQHERKGRSSVRQRVGSVEDNKPVKELVGLLKNKI